MIEEITPKAMADTIAVYCAHDKIVDTDELVGNAQTRLISSHFKALREQSKMMTSTIKTVMNF